MTFKYSRLLAIVLCGGAFTLTARAQSGDSINWRNFSYIQQSEAWFHSENAAGLSHLPVGRISVAEAFFEKQKGELADYYQSDNSYKWGAATESYYRLNPRVVFYGKVSYDNFTGKGMAGSAFIHPDEAPFDIMEFSDENRGEKNLENYHLVGALSGKLSDRWTLGAKLDFTAANYAKDKDLRHQNKLLDMYVTAGVTYRLCSALEVGANYYYRRSTEGLSFDTYGDTDKTYISLISYGAMMGRTEAFGSEGYTRDNYERPLFNEYQGGALQLSWQPTSSFSWYNEFTYKSRDGYYGKKSPYTAILTDHNSDIFGYNAIFSLKEGKNRHDLNVTFRGEELENYVNIYQTENSGGGVTNVVYYGKLKAADKATWLLGAEYTGNFGVTDYCPAWVIKGGATYSVRDTKASVYPYYRKQNLKMTDIHVSAERNLVRQKNLYNLLLGAAYHSGSGDAKEDGFYATPSEGQQEPAGMDTYLYREYDYLTARQVKGEIGLKYARALESQDIKCHVSLRYEVRKAFDAEYLGNGLRHEVRLAVGCTF